MIILDYGPQWANLLLCGSRGCRLKERGIGDTTDWGGDDGRRFLLVDRIRMRCFGIDKLNTLSKKIPNYDIITDFPSVP